MSVEADPLLGLAPPADSCAVDAPRALSQEEIRQMTRQRLLQQMENVAPGEEIRPLNGRGYNYQSPRSAVAEMALIRAEAERQTGP